VTRSPRRPYSAYKQFGKGKFPTHIVTRQGGFPVLDITVTKAEINPIMDSVPIPQSVQASYNANPPPARNAPVPPAAQR